MLAMSRKEGFHDLFARVPEELWHALVNEAEQEVRSANAQLIVILRERYATKKVSKPPKSKPKPSDAQ